MREAGVAERMGQADPGSTTTAAEPGAGHAGASPKRSLFGFGIALFSAIVFATSGSFAKPLLEAGWTSGAAVGARMLGAALVLLLPTLWVLRGKWHTVAPNWKPIVLFGVFGVAICQFSYFQAVQYLDVSVALLLEYMAPILIVLAVWAVTRRSPRLLTILGAVTSVVGLVLVLDVSGAKGVEPLGVMWGLIAAVGLAVFFVVGAQQNDSLNPLVLTTGGLLVGSALIFGLGALGLLPMRATFGTVSFSGFETEWWVALAGLTIIAAVLAYLSGIFAARALGATLASFIGLTEVIFAVTWAWLLLGEMPAAIQLLGGLCIVAGVILVRADELRQARKLVRNAGAVV
ncbi:EamA family transporter [Zhihengliuella salsuginis]|uniref:Membrane protein n=1 Tax=Zhihengliuella salsuginis TaxID=578222 RepID=A0ABQ3GMD5_9MICC|nr:DMT family transporter [Zhihengliuella salsuginis]GHD13313.1 membrane protein [Zhihengliuella salsuginis]